MNHYSECLMRPLKCFKWMRMPWDIMKLLLQLNMKKIIMSFWKANQVNNEYFDPERPVFQQQGDIGPLLQLPAVTFENSVEIIADKMYDEEYGKDVRSLNQSQYELFLTYHALAATKDKQETCCLHGGA